MMLRIKFSYESLRVWESWFVNVTQGQILTCALLIVCSIPGCRTVYFPSARGSAVKAVSCKIHFATLLVEYVS